MERSKKCLEKLDRMNKVLRHVEPDRIPISDFFWGSFVERWKNELNLSADADPYYHYDLDWVVTIPNMDPWIQPFETIKEDKTEGLTNDYIVHLVKQYGQYPLDLEEMNEEII